MNPGFDFLASSVFWAVSTQQLDHADKRRATQQARKTALEAERSRTNKARLKRRAGRKARKKTRR